jgi:hypothetical protein
MKPELVIIQKKIKIFYTFHIFHYLTVREYLVVANYTKIASLAIYFYTQWMYRT